jgi:peptide deformylase
MFKILTIANKNEIEILHTRSEEVLTFDKELKNTVEEMYETMITPDPKTEIRGMGIAANQVGILKRIIIVTFNYETNKKQKIVTMINPEILEASKQEKVLEEGCLSVPGKWAKIKRSSKVKVKWQNLEGNFCEKKLEKWDARIFLHEYDHLEGVIFIDYLK